MKGKKEERNVGGRKAIRNLPTIHLPTMILNNLSFLPHVLPQTCIELLPTSSVQFSRSVVSDSSRPHESQHTRPPCPSPTPGIHSDSHPSSSVMPSSHLILCCPLLLLPLILPASESFPMSQLFSGGGQSIGVSALASVLPKNVQD